MGKSIFWHRRDLRVDDNAGLYYALKESDEVQPIFIFDTNILHQLPKNDQRVIFIHQNVKKLKESYQKLGSDLFVFYGEPKTIILDLMKEGEYDGVYTNRDYEPTAIERDKFIFYKLKEQNKFFRAYKDQVIFDKNEIVKIDGKPYTIFTPYSKKWKENLTDFYLKIYPTEKYFEKLSKSQNLSTLPTLKEIGFQEEIYNFIPEKTINKIILKYYHLNRDYPYLDQTSRLSVHLRFGTLSIRKLVQEIEDLNEVFLNELIWREFYQMIIYHFPHSIHSSFKREYDAIIWENDEMKFKAWCEGNTGFPIVDAGMRELNETGFMHNRVRMIVASFLTKDLHIDWRWGEAYFALKLMDYEQASNVGGWQWAASSGCDAAPYFRIFNPDSQQDKFDKEKLYIKKWIPEFGTDKYPKPVVDHKIAREKTLKMYKEALNKIN